MTFFSVLIACVLRLVYVPWDPNEPWKGISGLDEPGMLNSTSSNPIYSAFILTANPVVHDTTWRRTDLCVCANIPPVADTQLGHISRHQELAPFIAEQP